MLKKISKNIKRRIAKALAAAFVFVSPFTASAMEKVPISWNDKQIFEVQYYGTGDKNDTVINFFDPNSAKNMLVYNLTPSLKQGLNKAFYWWAEILAPGVNLNQPAQYFVGTYEEQNADAMSFSIINDKDTQNPFLFGEIFQRGRVVEHFKSANEAEQAFHTGNTYPAAFGRIRIGQNMGINENDGEYGWMNMTYYALPLAQALKADDITPVMFHEIAHSLGLLANRSDNPHDVTYNETPLLLIGDGAANPLSYTSHLRNQFGKAPKPDMWIMTSKIFQDPELHGFFKDKVGKDLTEDDVFIFDDVDATTGRDGKAYVYFVGDNVTEALGGKTFTRFDGVQVSGIPINLWEDGLPEISHTELARSLMSHQRYRSYNNFIEAELALLQDIGYHIDRKNFYGCSIYPDNQTIVNDQTFSARENGQYVSGYNNSTMGTGLHVYGSNNTVTQRANIWTNGYGAVGIRIDGLNDKIIVPQGTEIHSDGILGTGILIAYGKNHDITIDGTVTANGDGGDAIHFDFGANSLGGAFEYRGSFMRYIRVLDDNGHVAMAKNLTFTEFDHSNDDYSITDRQNGDINEKLGSLNVNGKLESKSGAAIHISEESFIDKININKGAEINGNINSLWKNFDADYFGIYDAPQTVTYKVAKLDENGKVIGHETQTGECEPLCVQYKGNSYVYKEYIPDLVTEINFNAGDGEIFYNGDINGSNNIKINVMSGTVHFNGKADVISVNVAKGAKLIGGTFTVNDMTAHMAKGFSDETTGKFINHGTLDGVTVNGELVSDGIKQ